ncbi:MAG: nitroreductase family protein [Bacillota bacterium]
MCLTAYAQGLGTCWTTAPLVIQEQIKDHLGIQDAELVGVIPTGYPEALPKPPKRKADRVIWHR